MCRLWGQGESARQSQDSLTNQDNLDGTIFAMSGLDSDTPNSARQTFSAQHAEGILCKHADFTSFFAARTREVYVLFSMVRKSSER